MLLREQPAPPVAEPEPPATQDVDDVSLQPDTNVPKQSPPPPQAQPRRPRKKAVCVQCLLCNDVFDNSSECMMHIREQHAADVYICRLDDCKFAFQNSYELNRHQSFCHRSSMKIRPAMKGASVVVPPAPKLSGLRPPQQENFFCHICRAVFKKKRYMLKHLRRMHAPKSDEPVGRSKKQHVIKDSFRCAHCKAAYSRKKFLENHMLQKHCAPEPKSYTKHQVFVDVEYSAGNICPYCNLSFRRLASHVKKTHLDADAKWNGKFEVEEDSIVVEKPASRTPSPEKQNFCCHVCWKIFTDKASMRMHMHQVHLSKSPRPSKNSYFECAHCEAGYVRKKFLEDHMLRKHVADPDTPTRKVVVRGKKVCPICKKTFIRLNSHIVRSHRIVAATGQSKVQEKKNEKLFKCYFCEHKLSTAQGRYGHVRSKHQDALLKCPIATCKMQFVSAKFLEGHVRNQHVEAVCDFCDKCFGRTSALTEHIKVSHSCGHDSCTRFFKRKDDLAAHVLSAHSQKTQDINHNVQIHPRGGCAYCKVPGCDPREKRVVCINCKKTFHCEPQLEEHQSVACKSRDYVCSSCDKFFPSSHALKVHKTVVQHPEDENVWMGLWRGLHFIGSGIKCDGCRIFFSRQEDLNEHLALAHPAIE